MKHNNKLNLIEYLQVVNEIVTEFFDSETYEYTPQIGEIYSVCAYYNHCVTLEDTDEIVIHPIEDIMDMQLLFDDEEFMQKYNNEIQHNGNETSLLFGNAYKQAKQIVDYKKNDANALATAISAGMGAMLKSFKESFSDDEIKAFTDIASQVVEGKLSADAIAKAYENSDRFKDNTDELNKPQEEYVIPFPQKK